MSDRILQHVFREDSACLLFHDDADGCCAAAILETLLQQQTSHGFLEAASPEKHSVEMTSGLDRKLRELKPKFIISVDLAFTGSRWKIKTLLDEIDSQMLIYDHHLQSKNVNWPQRCLHINPFNFNLGNRPASCFSYAVYRHYTRKDDACWVAACGTIADHRTEECSELINQVKRSYPHLYPFKTISQHTAESTPLMKMAHLVNAGYQHSDSRGAKIAFEALKEALQTNKPGNLLEGQTEKAKLLHGFREEVNEELGRYVDKFNHEAERHKALKVWFYSIQPRFDITSQIASELVDNYPDTIIAVISPETNRMLKASLRKGERRAANLSLLAEVAVQNLNAAFGGGHQDAAGSIFRKEDLNVWKANVLEHLRKYTR